MKPSSPPTTFLTLPAELHLIIHSHLPHHDLLPLLLTSRQLHSLYSIPPHRSLTPSDPSHFYHSHIRKRRLITAHQRIEQELSTSYHAQEQFFKLTNVICSTCGHVKPIHSATGFDDTNSSAVTRTQLANRKCIRCAHADWDHSIGASQGWYWGQGSISGVAKPRFRVTVAGSEMFACEDCKGVKGMDVLWEEDWAREEYTALFALSNRAISANARTKDTASAQRTAREKCKECWVSHWRRFADFCRWRDKEVEEGEGEYMDYWEMVARFGRAPGRQWEVKIVEKEINVMKNLVQQADSSKSDASFGQANVMGAVRQSEWFEILDIYS